MDSDSILDNDSVQSMNQNEIDPNKSVDSLLEPDRLLNVTNKKTDCLLIGFSEQDNF